MHAAPPKSKRKGKDWCWRVDGSRSSVPGACAQGACYPGTVRNAAVSPALFGAHAVATRAGAAVVRDVALHTRNAVQGPSPR